MTQTAHGRRSSLVPLVAALLGSLAATLLGRSPARAEPPRPAAEALFARDNLVAWCIVPFDAKKRAPEDRAAMLERLGFHRFAYDWRAEHVSSFDAEMEALARHHIHLQAFWLAPGELNDQARRVLDLLRRHDQKTELWVILNLGADRVEGAEQERRVEAAAAKLAPLAREAAAIGCTVGLYNHGGWFGEPENQVAVIERLRRDGITNAGLVYNLHHGHAHLGRLREVLALVKPYLLALNLNGMDPQGETNGRKILPLGQGADDLGVLRTVRDSGYRGPIGILGHTMDDAEARLRDNLDGLDWLLPQLEGKPAGPRPTPATPVPPGPAEKLLKEARTLGDPARGAAVFADARFACLSCHRVGKQGGTVGPELSAAGVCLTPEQVVESVLWPRRQVKEGYAATAVATADGRVVQGYVLHETERELAIREATTGTVHTIARADVEGTRALGSLMPEGLAESMTGPERRDLVRFLIGLGRPGETAAGALARHVHAPASFPYDRGPLRPELWPHRNHPVNRERVYDFYAKEAEYFARQPEVPAILPPYPGLDGGREGHWGNQNDDVWADGRWNQTDLGSLLCGVFRGAGVTVPKGVCVRLGDRGELAACFNPQTLSYEALWKGGFLTLSPHRHGFLDGLAPDGQPMARPVPSKPEGRFVYHGFYRHGRRVVFSYRLGETEMLDAPWVEDGKFTRVVAPAAEHPLASLTHGGPPQWPETFVTVGKRGDGRPYAIDTIEPPFANPWNALLFFGDHDFLDDGTAMLCTMQGDVWRVEGLDDSLSNVRWRRFASGLHQALGLVVVDGLVHVLGRDQITRLHDLNGDGEADFYECVSNAYATSPAGHDFISGLERDADGHFYTASSKQGLLRIDPNGKDVQVVATGFRNPDGLGRSPEGVLTVPSSEGNWVPASMVCEVRPGGHYGYGGPREKNPPDLPLVYLPRGLDNSSAGQVTVPDDRWGPLKGQMLHLSYGAGNYFLLLREQVGGQPQGAVVPLPGDFRSGIHRARFSPKDGQLYLTGMGGWGTYTPLDGCFQRVRYTGGPVQLPVAFHARENGVLLEFSSPLDPAAATRAEDRFAQAWNYRYSPGYGSQEFSPRHPGMPGHDPLEIRSATVLEDGRTLFLEIPDLQPVNQLHLHVKLDAGPAHDVFATVHRLGPPFTGFAGYRPAAKVIAAHPILADMAALSRKAPPNRWGKRIKPARIITIEAGKNLTFSTATIEARAGEALQLTFQNPDVVPHNWALIRPGTLPKVGELVNQIVADPEAVARHYVPRSDDVLVHTDMVYPQDQFTIWFRAPKQPGRYPYLCTFPGHWMIMNGVLVVK